MDWLVEVTSERYYGPTTLGAIREFLRLGEIGPETFIINSCDGTRRPIEEFPELMQETSDQIDTSGDAPRAIFRLATGVIRSPNSRTARSGAAESGR